MQPVRSWVGGHAGLYTHHPTDERCSSKPGLTAGVEARTRGPWLAAVGVDLMAASETSCVTIGKVVEFGGELVEEFTGTAVGPLARVSLRGGRAIRLFGIILEPAAGLGLVGMPLSFVSGREMVWRTWYGGSLGLRSDGFPVGIRVEYGARKVPTRYYVYRSGWEKVHEFDRWSRELRVLLSM